MGDTYPPQIDMKHPYPPEVCITFSKMQVIRLGSHDEAVTAHTSVASKLKAGDCSWTLGFAGKNDAVLMSLICASYGTVARTTPQPLHLNRTQVGFR